MLYNGFSFQFQGPRTGQGPLGQYIKMTSRFMEATGQVIHKKPLAGLSENLKK